VEAWEYISSVKITRELLGDRMFPVTLEGLDGRSKSCGVPDSRGPVGAANPHHSLRVAGGNATLMDGSAESNADDPPVRRSDGPHRRRLTLGLSGRLCCSL